MRSIRRITWLPTLTVAALLLPSLAITARGQQPPPTQGSPGNTISVQGMIKFLDESDVAALREGVIREIEFRVGDRIEANQEIGRLHDDIARLKVARQTIAAESQGAILRARAQRDLAMEEMARLDRLKRGIAGAPTESELAMQRARVFAADAEWKAAIEEQNLAKADLDLANRELEEHIIRAPFTGYVTSRSKDAGEAVQANEPVIRLGRSDRLVFTGAVPLESAVRITLGDRVEVQAEVPDGDLAIEKVKLQGQVTSLGREVSTVERTEVFVYAEFDNPLDQNGDTSLSEKLPAGVRGRMTIHLGTGDGQPPARVAASRVPANPAADSPAATATTSTATDLPVLPGADPRR